LQEVELVQFMGKDNVPFHTVIFPATLLGTGQHWTMMRSISVTEYLNYEGTQFSKSRGTGVPLHHAERSVQCRCN
jgi:methionyl-tRNA synthetase